MLAIITTAQEVVSALAHMHERDIIHGDVRGANIMLCSSTANQRGFTAQVELHLPAQIQKRFQACSAVYAVLGSMFEVYVAFCPCQTHQELCCAQLPKSMSLLALPLLTWCWSQSICRSCIQSRMYALTHSLTYSLICW